MILNSGLLFRPPCIRLTLWAVAQFYMHIAYICRGPFVQWRRNEFESEGHRSGEKRRKTFFGRAPHFLALKAKLVVLVSAFVMVSTVC